MQNNSCNPIFNKLAVQDPYTFSFTAAQCHITLFTYSTSL